MKKYHFTKFAVAILLTVYSATASAQLNPMGAMYFQNQYLNNPAFAGIAEGLKINIGFRKQMTNIPGAPINQMLTADYSLNNKVGLGLSFQNDRAGLITRTRGLASYAYHLPLNANESKLSFGISLGFLTDKIDYSRLDGDGSDLTVSNFNKREVYIDGDFGIAYTDEKITLQASLPNLKSFFKTDQYQGNVADEARYLAAASYNLQLQQSFSIEPKVCFRSVKGYDNIIDIGGKLAIVENRVSLTAFYHTSQNATVGLGAKLTEYLTFQALYTSGTAPMRTQTSGDFEVNVKLEFGK